MTSSFQHESAYGPAVKRLDHFGSILKSLLERTLLANNVNFHSVTYRVKSEESARLKLAAKGDRYKKIADLQDLLGVRLIMYFPDDVDRAASVIANEFHLNSQDSVDKRASLDPDRFGYLSLHYVLMLGHNRSQLSEYAAFRDIQFELQIRSILQHSWAEIEHDLGYKHAAGVPSGIRRRFSRLAGLLEIADDEFSRLRDDLAAYSEEVRSTSGSELAELEINQTTLREFIQRSDLVHEVDELVLGYFTNRHTLNPKPQRSISLHLDRLALFDIRTIRDLQETLAARKEDVVDYTRAFFTRYPDDEDDAITEVDAGVSLFYLEYVIVASMPSPERLNGLAASLDLDDSKMLGKIISTTWNDVIQARSAGSLRP